MHANIESALDLLEQGTSYAELYSTDQHAEAALDGVSIGSAPSVDDVEFALDALGEEEADNGVKH